MLDTKTFQDHRPDEDISQPLDPANIYAILKRRALYFVIPFLAVSIIGALITLAWPSRYISRGTILISSQEIPSDLVRPTVSALANDRIQLIAQRIMTRDNLLAIAKKFQLSAGWQARVSGTELIDFIKDRVQIKAADDRLQGAQSTRRKDAVAFTVSFDYERPDIATKVANELVTMILNEDVRSRTEFAAQTAKFMEQEVKRLEAQLGLVNTQITEFQRLNRVALTDTSKSNDAKDLAALRAELLLKSASYSDEHPDIKALKRKVQALEKSMGTSNEPAPSNTSNTSNAAIVAATTGPGLDTLETQRKGLREELNKAQEKLSAARMGESLERGQHSERLEVIEQPVFPVKPDSPKKPKILAFVFALALMAGGGLVFAAEMLNQSIRKSTDLYSIFDSHLLVSIPYITTNQEALRKKNKIIVAAGISITVVLIGLIVLYFILPPLDILFDKVMAALFR